VADNQLAIGYSFFNLRCTSVSQVIEND